MPYNKAMELTGRSRWCATALSRRPPIALVCTAAAGGRDSIATRAAGSSSPSRWAAEDEMLKVAIVALLIAVLGLIVWRRSDQRLMPESEFTVVVTDDDISVTDPNGVRHRVALLDLGSVRIRTNDSGPVGTDVIWGFHDRSGAPAAVVPGGATGEREMLIALSKLPGWRDDVVIEAMGSTSNREFICWERGPSQ